MDRRQFFKFTAVTGAASTLAGCGNPEAQLMRFIPDEEIIPGIAITRNSICPLCSSGCGVQVRVMEGDAEVIRNNQLGLMKMPVAKKLEGNPMHPISQGKLCARGQASIQLTYHPDRLQAPMKRAGERGSGQFTEITWEEALTELTTKLNEIAAASNQQSLAFITKPLRGQRSVLVSQFLSRFGAPAAVEYEVLGDQVLRRANLRSFGYEQLPTIDLANSRYVISFGADFLGTWNSPVAQNVAYGEMRQGHPGFRSKFVQVEPRMSQTGANADDWVPAKPGTEGVLALGLAHVILRENLRPNNAGRAGAQVEGFAGGLAAYAPEEVSTRTGVSVERIERLAREFATHQPAVAFIGGAPLANTNGMFNALAVNALNALAGSVGQPGGITFMPRPNLPAAAVAGTELSIAGLAANINAAAQSPVQVLLLKDANPVFGTPAAWRVREALAKVPYIASFGSFIDDTSVLSDLILPDHSFLESWVDDVPESGATTAVASVAGPAMRPMYQTRAMADVLLEVGRGLAAPLNPAFTFQTYQEMLGAAFGDAFSTAQEQGGVYAQTAAAAPAAAPAASAAAIADPQFDGDPTQYPYHFLPYASQQFNDGSIAHLPWLQELPDVLTTAMWSSWIEINLRTAATLGIVLGDMIEVTSAHGTLRAPAVLSPGIAPDVIAMPIGQGHETFTRYASGRGANPLRILAPAVEPETGSLAWAATRVRIAKVGGDSNLILFARTGELREHAEHPR
jgi:anaerobic selenocysteine-containing dehydrogenase